MLIDSELSQQNLGVAEHVWQNGSKVSGRRQERWDEEGNSILRFSFEFAEGGTNGMLKLGNSVPECKKYLEPICLITEAGKRW